MAQGRYRWVKTPDPIYVIDEDDAEDWCEYYMGKDRVGFDTETTGLHKLDARIKFFSFGDQETRTCFPVRLLPHLVPVLQDEGIIKAMTNAKFDMHMLASHGVRVHGDVYDTIAQDFLIDENRQGQHGLKQTAKEYLGLRMAPFKEVFGAIGKTDAEVQMVCDMHDCLEAQDAKWAAHLLLSVGKAEGDAKVLDALKKLCVSRRFGCTMNAKKVLKIARDLGIAGKTAGKAGYVADFFSLLGHDLQTVKEREAFQGLFDNADLLEEFHDVVIDLLMPEVKLEMDPLAMLELLVGDYASLDAWASFMLSERFEEELELELIDDDLDHPYTLKDLFLERFVPFTRVLWNMERRGFMVDPDKIEALSVPMGLEIGKLEREWVKLLKKDVNMGSPQQLLDVFFTKDRNGDWVDVTGSTPKVWTDGGTSGIKNPSTKAEVIEELAGKGNAPAKVLLQWRSLTKLRSTFLDAMGSKLDHRSRIHTTLNQTGARTGRLSSNDPNLQNIPSKGAMGKAIRQCFVAGLWGDCGDWCLDEVAHIALPDYPPDQPMTLLVADYEQLEMRIMAHMSQDPDMLRVIHEGKDLHSFTAAMAEGYDYDEVAAAKKAANPTPKQLELLEVRRRMKAVGFGILYGIGALKLGMDLGLPIVQKRGRNGQMKDTCPEAEALIKRYFEVFPGVKQFIVDTHDQCAEDLYVQTLIGRFRRLPDIASTRWPLKGAAQRQSVNSIIQGSAADICNEAMLKSELSEELRALGVRLLLQIHDELVFEVPDIPEVIEKAKKLVRTLMENPFDMLVPIIVSMDVAHTWGDAK
jgi:DNA polymerase I-like protein with 3'-5' exonuclease and polymerase domains